MKKAVPKGWLNEQRGITAIAEIKQMTRVIAEIQGENAATRVILLALIRSHPDRQAFSDALQAIGPSAFRSLEELEYSRHTAQKTLQSLLVDAGVAAEPDEPDEPGDASS